MRTKEKGITLITLVITIIILLILAGISIAELTGSGLFAQAEKAKLEAKRSTITEWLSIKLIEEQTNNPTGTAKEIIGATKENVESHKSELEEIGKEVEIGDVQTEENWEKTDEYFYVIVDGDYYKVELEGVKFVGREDEFPPLIRITEVTNTTNTITVTVETRSNVEGTIKYFIKAEDEEEYIHITDKKDNEEKTYTYEELDQSKKYNIKVVAIAKNGKTAEAISEATTGKVTDLTTANTTFKYEPTGWTNENVTATASTTATGYTLQTSKDGKSWTSTASQTFTANGRIYARLWDGTNYGGTATGNVTNIDKTKPVVTGATATTNSIAITATDEASGSGIVGYAVTTSNVAPTSFTSCTNTKTLSTTVSGKTQGTTYYVWVKDQAGNISASKSTATGAVPNNITFSYTPTGWTNGNVTATASTAATGYTLQTSKDGKSWTSTASQTFTANGRIYARLWDGTNYGGTATGNVTNIDKMKPTIGSVTGSTATGNTGTVTARNIIDSGGSGLKGLYVSTSSVPPTATSAWTPLTTINYAYTVTTNGTYYVWVKDAAGNISDAKSCTVSGIVSKVSITAYNNLTIVAGNTGTPTLSYTGSPKSITYSSSNTGIATINASTGLVTGVAAGSTTMTVTLTNYDGTTVSRSCTVTVQTAVARIGSTNYASVQSAVNSTTSATITLLVNQNEEVTIPSGKTITLDLNSKSLAPGKITNNSTNMTIQNGTIARAAGYVIENAGILNINNAVIQGTNTNTSNAGSAVINTSISSSLTINNSTITNAGNYAIYNQYGRTTILSGTIQSYATATISIRQGSLVINGGTIETTASGRNAISVQSGEDNAISITGGSLKGQNAVISTESTTTLDISGGTLTATYGIIDNSSKQIRITGESTIITTTSNAITGTIGNLIIGTVNNTNNTYPLITAQNGYAVYNKNGGSFTMYSGRLRSAIYQGVYTGSNSYKSRSGYEWYYYSSSNYFGVCWRQK